MQTHIVMKKLIILVLPLLVGIKTYSQGGFAINTTGATANASAMLDVNSTSKGVLVPRMTSAQRSAIASPANGLLAYDTDTKSFWYYNGAYWIDLTTTDSSYWKRNGTHIYNGNTGKVGIGINLPLAKLHVADSSVLFSATGDVAIVPTGNVPISGAGRRMFWFPGRAAFRSGYVFGNQWDKDSIGPYSFAAGHSTLAKGYYSTAFGIVSSAIGQSSFAFGSGSVAYGDASFSGGYSSLAYGANSFAFGSNDSALGNSSIAIGYASARKDGSISIGASAVSNGIYSVSLGTDVGAYGDYSLALGSIARANGNYSTAFHNSTSNGLNSFSAIAGVADGSYALSIGQYSNATSLNAIAIGTNVTASDTNSLAIGGLGTTASGNYSKAFGYLATASGNHSTAIGDNILASGDYSFALGIGGNASGKNAVTLTNSTSFASGDFSLATGNGSTASGKYSTSMGLGTVAKAYGSFSVGTYNENTDSPDPNVPASTDKIFQIGIGDGNPINGKVSAMTVLRNGNVGIGTSFLLPSAKLEVNGTFKLTDGSQGLNKVLTSDANGLASWQSAGALGGYWTLSGIKLYNNSGVRIGIGTTNPLARLHVADSSVVFVSNGDPFNTTPQPPPVSGAGGRLMWYSDKLAFRVGNAGSNEWDKDSIGIYSIAMGSGPKATALSSVAIGPSSRASGTGSVAIGSSNNATAFMSTALGWMNTSSGIASLTAGEQNLSSGEYAVSFGKNNLSTDSCTFSMGRLAQSSAKYSLSMGFNSQAIQDHSFSFGKNSIANAQFGIAFGFNSLAAGDYSLSIGNNSNSFGLNSVAIGNYSITDGSYSFSLGTNTNGYWGSTFKGGNYSFALGSSCISKGQYSFAMGDNARALGDYSMSRGVNATAYGNGSVVIGNSVNNNSSSFYSFVMGTSIDSTGDFGFSFGNFSRAIGSFSLAMGQYLNSTGTFAYSFGQSNNTSGSYAASIGKSLTVSADYAFATGFSSVASSQGAVTMGSNNISSGLDACTIGNNNVASGYRSFATGFYTQAKAYNATTIGTYNDVSDNPSPNITDPQDRIFQIGNGNIIRSNAMTVLRNGNTGIGVLAPNAKLSLSSASTELTGSAMSSMLRSNSGSLGSTQGTEVSLANFGFLAGSNNTSLGIHAYRRSAGTDWTTTSILFGMDVDNTSRAAGGGSFFSLNSTGSFGISNANPRFPLTFAAVLGDKISLWDDGTNNYHYGIGVQSGQLQLHTDLSGSDITFGYGSSGAMTENVRFKGNGRVGIGTNNPVNRLDIAGIDGWDVVGGEGDVRIGNGSYRMKFGVALTGGGAGAASIMQYGQTGGYNALQLGSQGVTSVYVMGSGNVGIGTNAPTQKLHVIGNILASGTITPSDIRYKKNITLISSPLQKLQHIRGVNYQYKPGEFPGMGFTDATQIGFIAQEVEKVMPELVTTDDKGYKYVDYPKIAPVLVEAIKEQQKEIDELKKEIQEMKKMIQKN